MNTLRGNALKSACGLAFVLLVSSLAFDCMNKPLPPVAPTWETQLTAPVTSRSYTLADLVSKDSSLIHLGPGGTQLSYSTIVQSAPTLVGSLISLAPMNASTQLHIGPLIISPITLSMPVPFPQNFPAGQTSPIPPASFTAVPVSGALPGVDSVTFSSGTLILHVKNNLPVPVRILSSISLLDASGMSHGTFDFSAQPTVAPGAETTAAMDLAGQFLTHVVTLSGISLSEPGSASPVTIPPDSLVVATLTANNLVVQSVLADDIPPQMTSSTVTSSLALNDSNLVEDLLVKSGTAWLHIQSTSPVNITLRYTIAQILSSAGTPLSDSVTLGPGASADRTIDLTHYRLHSADGSFITHLDVSSGATLFEGSKGQRVRIDQMEGGTLQVTSSTIVADSIVGAVKPTYFQVNARTPLNLGDLSRKFHGQLNVPAANLRLLPQASFIAPMQLDLAVQARTNAGGVISTLNVPETKTTGVLGPIDFLPADVGRFFSTISGQLPDSLRVAGTVLLNPDYSRTTVTAVGASSWFGGQMMVSFPLSFSLTNGRLVDTLAFGDTSANGKGHTLVDGKFAGDINSVKLHVGLDNGIPLQFTMKLTLADINLRPLLILPQTAGDSITIAAPATSGGNVIASTHTERIIVLGGNEIPQFNSAAYAIISCSVLTPGSSPVNFVGTDLFKVTLWAEFAYQVNK